MRNENDSLQCSHGEGDIPSRQLDRLVEGEKDYREQVAGRSRTWPA